MAETARTRRALVQKLESLRRSGVQAVPRPAVVEASATAAATSAATTAASTAPAAPAPSPPSANPVQPAADTGVSQSPAPARAPTTSQPVASPPPAAPVSAPSSPAFAGSGMAAEDKPAALAIVASAVAACEKCPDLVRSRRQTVFGVGNPNARLVLFGEAPGADEDRLGEPFVGKAGQLLTKIIEACKMQREDVYIMNVLRCRPPANRNPSPEEANNCRPFFEKQFEIIRPEFIVCLGSVAATNLLQTQASVGRLRGKFHDWRGMKVVVTYHPAYLLRNASAKKHVWTDMKMLMKEMGVEL